MAITTYAELQTAVANWLERTDLTDRIPEFIALCESRLNRTLDIRTMHSDNAVVGVTNSRYIALPTGFREPIAMWRDLSTGRDPLEFVDPALIAVNTVAGIPSTWTVDGTNIAFDVPCDSAYNFTLRMVGALALSDSATTNYVLTNYPDVYLFGALTEAGPYLKDQDILTIYDTRFQSALAEMRAKENRNRSSAQLRTEPAGMQRAMTFNINRGW